MKLKGLLLTERIFFFKRINILFSVVCILLFGLETLLELFGNNGDELIDVNIFLTQNHLGKISVALAVLYLYGVSRDFRSKKIHNLIANGFSNKDIFLLKITHAIFIASISLLAYLLMNLLVSYIRVDAISFNPSIVTGLSYILVQLFFTSLFLLLYFITKNSLFTIIVLVGLAALEQFLKRTMFKAGNEFLPISSVSDVLSNANLNVWFIGYLLLFHLAAYLYIQKIKNWDRF